MATLGEFASLLQLGVGIGIGLSLFRSPIGLRTARLSRVLNDELTALRAVTSEFGKIKRREFMSLKIKFVALQIELDEIQMPFTVLTAFGSIANTILLIKASVSAQLIVDDTRQVILIFVSIFYFIIILLLLELLARSRLNDISAEITKIQTLTADSVQDLKKCTNESKLAVGSPTSASDATRLQK